MFSTRTDAKSHGERFYFTGKACKKGHVAPRYVATRACQHCQQLQDQQNYTKNAIRRKELSETYKRSNASHVAQTYQQWRRTNRGRVNALLNKRRSAVHKRTPPWANMAAIDQIYEQCAELNRIHGDRSYHVDHIIPLQGTTVSGLNVEYNLQILTGVANLRKSNKLEVSHA